MANYEVKEPKNVRPEVASDLLSTSANTPEILPGPSQSPAGSEEEGSAKAKELSSAVQPAAPSSQTIQPKDEVLEDIEDILEEDLDKVYAYLPPEKKKEFEEEGERTAKEIRGIVGQIKIKTRKILRLIKDWLKIIPGVNKFFLEQEAKIKTDEIAELAEEGKREGKL